jgi:methylated-DNA-[protein]-cysteine S-methyltransferase
MITESGALVRRTVASPIGPLQLVASPLGLRAVLWPGEDGSRVRLAPSDGRLPAPSPEARPTAPSEARPASPSGVRRAPRSDQRGIEVALERHIDPTLSRGEGEAAAGDVHLERAAQQLAEYFAGDRRAFDVALDPVGTPFQLEAWAVLRTIPFGHTISYGEQARALGDPARARAVGAANGRNPISIIVPCHRVVATSGALTGFAGGLDAKSWLLEHERRVLAAG